MEFEDKFKYTKVFEFFKELTKISTPKLPILFLAKSNLAKRFVSKRIIDIILIEFILKLHSEKSATLFLHFALQNSLNLKYIFSLKLIPISLHFAFRSKNISSLDIIISSPF